MWALYKVDQDLDAFVRNLAFLEGRTLYATDSTYASKILSLMSRADLRAAVEEARQA